MNPLIPTDLARAFIEGHERHSKVACIPTYSRDRELLSDIFVILLSP
jgi:hypothetical protein